MKYLLFLTLLLFCGQAISQNKETIESGEKIILENEKLKVIEHWGMPNKHVCGEGMHHHEPHLTVLISDAKVSITPEDGEPQMVEAKSGASIWFEAETHSVINLGEEPTRMILIYLKE